MFIVDIALKSTPSMLSVQRKTAEDAEAVYQEVLSAIRSGNGGFIELTCEKQTDKKLSILASEIAVVQVSEKSGAGGTARVPGFFALSSEQS